MQKSVIVLLLLSWMSCKEKEKADLIITQARIYTAEDSLPLASCMAVAHGRILAVGDEAAVIGFAGKGTQMVDIRGAFVMPGLIEGHGHFFGLGKSIYELNLLLAGSGRGVL